MKDNILYLSSWSFYYLGDLFCKIGYIKINNKYPFDFTWIYQLYNWFMTKSCYLQDTHSKQKGPWHSEQESSFLYIEDYLNYNQFSFITSFDYNTSTYKIEIFLETHAIIEIDNIGNFIFMTKNKINENNFYFKTKQINEILLYLDTFKLIQN